MVFKILLPALVGLLVYFLGKSHARREQNRALRPPSSPPTPPSTTEKMRLSFRLTTYVLLASALLSAVWFVYEDWQSSHQVVLIRVINAQTGKSTHYRAPKGEVHGRTFKTTDGRQIRLADVERMEMEPG